MFVVLLGCNCWIVLLVFCYGSGVIGVGDLIRVICCVSCYYVGCIVNGIVKLLYVYGLL